MQPEPTEREQQSGHAEVKFSSGFTDWLADQNCSIALTTFRSGKLIFIGLELSGKLSLQNQHVDHCQGLWSDGQSLIVSSLHMLWRFENILHSGVVSEDGADRVFMPRGGLVTGQIDIHDIAVGDLSILSGGKLDPIFVSTAFNCLATTSEKSNFKPLWHPPFINKIVGEDRCHLNGLAMCDGHPAYVTSVASSNVRGGWREQRQNGGILLDIQSGDAITSDLSMPHSPRFRDGDVWLLDSGRGHLIRVNLTNGERTVVVANIPGYARGLSFAGWFAVIGVSRPRSNNAFSGLELDESLNRQGIAPICGVVIVDTKLGEVIEWIEFTQPLNEIYDVAVLPDCRRPEGVILESEQTRTTITVEGS